VVKLLDVRFVRENIPAVRRAIEAKGEKAALDDFLLLDTKRRDLLQEVEKLKHQRNVVSKDVGRLKKEGRDATELVEKMRLVNERIKELDEEQKQIETAMEKILLHIPNLPDPEVPVGSTEEDNKEVRRWGDIPKFKFNARPHWELGERLGILDFPRAGKMTGSRFVLYKGEGARLERALINFMLDLHTSEHGYKEIFPPFFSPQQEYDWHRPASEVC